MSNSFYHERYRLTKAQREIIEPLLPAPKSTGPPGLNPLTVFNAILWILSSGAAWRDLPPQFGNWNSIYHKFRLLCTDDVFDNILRVLVSDTESCKKIGQIVRLPTGRSESNQLFLNDRLASLFDKFDR